MHYRAEIDGLRAVAVIPVILFHAGFEVFSGGFVGVDVFFVISGYLITSIILSEMDKKTFSLARFYERRARRILPALIFVTAVCIPFAWAWLMPFDLKDFAKSLVAVPTFSANILFWQESGYFDTHSELKPLLHTWSLAVEEQYYILFPLFLMITWNIGKNKIFSLLLIIAIFSLVTAQWGASSRPNATFYLLPTRGWEILLGCFIAFHFGRVQTWGLPVMIRQALSLFGLAMITFSVFTFDNQTSFPGFYALLPTFGAVLIIISANGETFVGRILRTKWLVGIGLISYSMYLWHQPLFAFAKYKSMYEPSALLMWALTLMTVPIAYFSWRFVECPFRRSEYLSRRNIFLWSVLASGCLIALGLIGMINDGFRERITFPPNVKWMSLGEKIHKNGDICSLQQVDDFEGVKSCLFGDVGSAISVALYGDSHAEAIGDELDSAFLRKGLRGVWVSLDGCEVVPRITEFKTRANKNSQKCLNYFENLKSYLSTISEATIVASRWTTRLYPITDEIDELKFNNGIGGVEKFVRYREYVALKSGDVYSSNAEAKKLALRELLNGLAQVNRVIVVYPVPEIGWDIFRENLQFYSETGKPLRELSFSKFKYVERNRFVLNVFDEIIEENSQIFPIRTDRIFCDGIIKGKCVAQIRSIPLYYDDHHLSDAGAQLVVKPIINLLAQSNRVGR